MAGSLKKRGQKFLNKFSKASIKASEEGREHIKNNLIRRIPHIEGVRLLILEWGLLVFALIMLATTQSIWFARSYEEKAFGRGGVYTEATVGNVNSLNPLFASTSSERTLSRLMFATISTNDYSGHFGIGLAKSITPKENGKIWEVKLRENLKWSDGEPLTNDDVLFTVGLIKSPAANTIYDSSLRGVEVIENENGVIIFKLPSAYADFISALNFPIVPKHILDGTDPKVLIEHNFSRSPVTSGAFSFNAMQSGATSEERIFYLTSNSNYYKGKTLLNSFAIHTYPSKEKIVDALNSGAVTATAELSDTNGANISSTFLKKNSSLNSGVFIFFNTTSGPTKDLALRSAIRQGISLESLRRDAPDTAALNYPILTSQIELRSYPSIPSQNIESAKNKIAELSGESKIQINIATVNSGFLPKVAENLKNELSELGIEATVSLGEEGQEFFTNVISKRNYDILIYEIELGAGPDLLPYYHSSQASASGLNLSNYRNALVDDLLLGARDTLNTDLRIKRYESFLNYWVNDVPAIALYQPNLTYYYNKNVRTFGNHVRLVTALDRFVDVNSWSVIKETKDKTP